MNNEQCFGAYPIFCAKIPFHRATRVIVARIRPHYFLILFLRYLVFPHVKTFYCNLMLRFIVITPRLIGGAAHHESAAFYPHKTAGRGNLLGIHAAGRNQEKQNNKFFHAVSLFTSHFSFLTALFLCYLLIVTCSLPYQPEAHEVGQVH
jgi:hypothetical protein